MRSTRQMSITLPVDMARMVKEKVAQGGYASESEVIREGLRALQERDAVVERWLRDQVGPAYDEAHANPGQLVDGDTVFAGLRARHARRIAKTGA